MEYRSRLYSRRDVLKKFAELTVGGVAAAAVNGCAIPSATANSGHESPLQTPEVAEAPVKNIPFQVGSINYGTEGALQGPMTRLIIVQAGEVRNDDEFVIDTLLRMLSRDDINPAGNYWKDDNLTYLNAGGVVVQTVHSGTNRGFDIEASRVIV